MIQALRDYLEKHRIFNNNEEIEAYNTGEINTEVELRLNGFHVIFTVEGEIVDREEVHQQANVDITEIRAYDLEDEDVEIEGGFESELLRMVKSELE